MFSLSDLTAADADRFAHLATGPYRALLAQLGSDVVAIGATLLGRPIGLAISQVLPGPPKSAVLHFLLVLPGQRRVGVATSLLHTLHRKLELRGCTRVSTTFTGNQTAALLEKCGWSPPEFRETLCRAEIKPLAVAAIPPDCTVVPWIDTTTAARISLAISGFPQTANPFLDEPVEPEFSLALLKQNEIAGWIIWAASGPTTLRCHRFFIRPDLRRGRVGLALLAQSLDRIRANDKWHQVEFTGRRFARYCTSVTDVFSSSKPLTPHELHHQIDRQGANLIDRIALIREAIAHDQPPPLNRVHPIHAAQYDPTERSVGPLHLLIFQPTPFCNIDCRYCYLSNRNSTAVMDLETVTATISRVREAELFGRSVEIAWHSGEPLVVPAEFYVEAIHRIRQLVPAYTRIQHTIQTNGTLLNEKWCDILKSLNVTVGLSLDGPAFIHDAARVTRSGQGTHRRVMEGLRLLQQTGIRYYVLSVLSSLSLRHPGELFDFYRTHGIRRIGFLTEEVQGIHDNSTLTRDHIGAYRQFMSRFYDLCRQHPNDAPDVREFSRYESIFLHANLTAARSAGQTGTPYGCLNVDAKGDFATFSPELLDVEPYILGNVHHDSLREVLKSDRYQHIEKALHSGIEMCQKTCDYFTACGGGMPSSKVSENGTLASTETMECTLRVQNLVEILLSKLEHPS